MLENPLNACVFCHSIDHDKTTCPQSEGLIEQVRLHSSLQSIKKKNEELLVANVNLRKDMELVDNFFELKTIRVQEEQQKSQHQGSKKRDVSGNSNLPKGNASLFHMEDDYALMVAKKDLPFHILGFGNYKKTQGIRSGISLPSFSSDFFNQMDKIVR